MIDHQGGPVAVDESQAGILNYVCASLLAAWDASFEGPKGKRTYEMVRTMAKIYNLELFANPGEMIVFDPEFHESDSGEVQENVKVLRPGILWLKEDRRVVQIRALVS